MGCDIHISLEIMNIDGKWQEDTRMCDAIIPDERFYKVWGFLFDIRCDADYLEFPYASEGWPEDVTIEDNEDFHSHTVINYDPVVFDQLRWPKELSDCYFRTFLEHVWGRFKKTSYIKEPCTHHTNIRCNGYWDHPMRMIIAFDN